MYQCLKHIDVEVVVPVFLIGCIGFGCCWSNEEMSSVLTINSLEVSEPSDRKRRGRVMILVDAIRDPAHKWDQSCYESIESSLHSLGFECIPYAQQQSTLKALKIQANDLFYEDVEALKKLGAWKKMDLLILVKLDLRYKDPWGLKSRTRYWTCPLAFIKAVEPYENTMLWKVYLSGDSTVQLTAQRVIAEIISKMTSAMNKMLNVSD